MQIWTKLDSQELFDAGRELDIRVAVSESRTMRSGPYAGQYRHAGVSLRPWRTVSEGGGEDRYRAYRDSFGGGVRRIHAVCWHGHRDWMRALFALDPDARIKTAMADYRESDGFERVFPATGDRNIGSQMHPLIYRDACYCADEDRLDEVATTRDLGVKVTSMKQADIQACPHAIFVPEHYRTDGSCKCDDPNEAVMAEWGYTWAGGVWR